MTPSDPKTPFKILEDTPHLRELHQNGMFARTLVALTVPARYLGKRGRAYRKWVEEQGLEELADQLESHSTLPDRFNQHFLSRGWIAYEHMNSTVMESAIAMADLGDIDAGEQLLVDHYTPETVSFQLQMMRTINAYGARDRLARLALVDYEAGRFYACVPLLLSLVDGLAASASPTRLSPFREGAEFVATDSFSAHPNALTELVKLFGRTRRKTTEDSISIPYRNGILHGQDLGFDNKLVAAKTWALLFSLRNWACAAEGKPQTETKAPPTLKETWAMIRSHSQLKSSMEAWKGRDSVVLPPAPHNDSEIFEADSPERVVAGYLVCWKAQNYGGMAGFLQPKRSQAVAKEAGLYRQQLKELRQLFLEDFEITGVVDGSPLRSDVSVRLRFKEKDEPITTTIVAICENDAGDGAPFGTRDARWRVYDWFLASLR